MNRTKQMMMGWSACMVAGLLTVQAAPPPPPPPGDGGSIKPPDLPPPGKIYFEDNVVIVGPGFVKPETGGGTIFVDISKVNPDVINKDGQTPGETIERVIREVSQVKSQVEAASAALPPGLLNPISMLMLSMEQAENGLFEDPTFLMEETAGHEPAVGGPDESRTGGASVQAAPDAPALHQPKRSAAGEAVIPSYWQLPIR